MPFCHIPAGRASLDVSIVVPVHDEQPNIETLAAEIDDAMGKTSWMWECVWVDDHSSDGTLDTIRRLHARDARHLWVTLGARAGQSPAIAAGISISNGKYIATLDGDGQNDPSDVPRLLVVLVENHLHVVNGRRENRCDNFVRKVSSRIANRFRNALTGDSVTDVGCSLRVFRREAVDGLPVFKAMHRFFPTLIRMNGYDRITEVPVSHRPRHGGRTKYGISNRLWVGITDTFAVRWMKTRMAAPRIADSSRDLDTRTDKEVAG
jgi:dolichol-phosphate mannosyltransferase